MDDAVTNEDVVISLFPGGVSLLMELEPDPEELTQLCLDLVEAAGGRPWFISVRLIGVMKANWNVLGAEMLLRGVDATQLSLSGWLDVALLITLRNMDPKDVTMFTMKLELPPTGGVSTQEEPAELEMSRDQFLSMMR